MPRSEPKLAPCPKCGVVPEAEDVDAGRTWMVGCWNDSCEEAPEVFADTKAAAIAAWNTRWRADDGV